MARTAGPRRGRNLSNGRVARRLAVAAVALVGLTSAAATSIAASPARPGAPAATRVADRFLAPAAAGADGWQTATPAAAGMDPTTLDQARTYAFAANQHTQGVVVVRGGKLVQEWYAPGEGPDSWAASWSVGKSFASAMIGIAISQGKIPSVDEPLSTYFPEWAGTAKGAITIKDVLHMASGLQWNEDYNPADLKNSDIIQMGLAADELAYAKSRPLAHTPGTHWYYSSGDAMLLSGIIQKATGMSADQYAQQVLFGPLGMKQVEQWQDGAGHALTYCCTDTTSRNFARFGLLYLNHGNWNGTQVVPSSWVDDSFNVFGPSNGEYGYMWWFDSLENLFPSSGLKGPVEEALGFDGQFIYIIPSLDLVVVRNGDYVKSACPPVADPNLFSIYPPHNIIPGQGTRPPDNWNDADFLGPIVKSVTGPDTSEPVVPAPESQPTSRDPSGQAMAPCPASTTPTTTSVPAQPPAPAPVAASPATAVDAKPTYTG